ncbi:MAG: NAD-dependent epimerase/dehydratase family protein [Planctomycetota bacterium]|jgi:nucleoside-diphosphate-sugar epimerase
MSKFLVTGGAGFVGLNLIHHLCSVGEKIVIYDDLSTSRKKYLRDLPKDVKLIEGTVLDVKELKKAGRGCDYMVHLGGNSSVLKSVKDPVVTMEINAMGTLNALIAARHCKVKRFIYVGSSAAYGESPSLPKVESMNDAPLSPLAVSTIAAENMCRVFFNTYGLQTVILRAFNLYGPFQETTGPYAPVVGKFISMLIDGKPPLVAGDGKQSRDFVYVADLVEAIKSACIAPKAEGELFNIGTGSRITVNGLVNMINGILGKEIQPKYEEARPGDIRHSLADTTKAQEMLGYRPRTTVMDGLASTIEWYRKNR